MDGEADRLVGLTLEGRYLVEGVVGTGGFAVVYRARHVTLQRAVAVKVLRTDPALGDTMRSRFEREARVLATLSHPSIVGVTDFGVAEDQPYLVMELLEGKLLREAIDEGGMTLARSLSIAKQILDGLAHAHEQGVVHLDLKPTNVLLQAGEGGRDRVKILDFGFAKWFGNAARDDETPLTMMGQAFGTPGYVAPERMSGLPADARADLYALGVILFEMVSGRRPYEGEGLEVMRAQLEEPIPSVAALRPELGATATALDAVVQRAMAREPTDRWPDAATMRAALDRVPVDRGRGGPFGRVLAAVGVLALVALGLVWVLLDGKPERDPTGGQEPAAIPALVPEAEEPGAPAIGGRDPWSEPIPPELEPFHRRLEAGERLRTSELAPLFSYVRTHPGDARPHLLFARAYMKLGWRDAVLQRYVRAHQDDPSSRGDPQMLRDLLLLATEAPAGGAAARAAASIYDREALPAIDRVLEALEGREEARLRVRWVRDRIATRAPGAGD